MNKKRIVTLSNAIGLVSIILLIYWVFIFISVEVFGLKVFRENLTETFYMSVFGILALMVGTLMINIMMNLTIIASKHTYEDDTAKSTKRYSLLFLISFPLIFGLLYLGDYLSANAKKQQLVNAAEKLIQAYPQQINALADYRYNKEYVNRAGKILEVLSKTEERLPNVSVIIPDTIESVNVYLNFGGRYMRDVFLREEDSLLNKKDYIFSASQPEQHYMNQVFHGEETDTRFSSSDGNYELYFPYRGNSGQTIILYFTDHQRYGKIGS